MDPSARALSIGLFVLIALLFAFEWMHDRRITALERALRTPAPAVAITAPAAVPHETPRARYERLYQATRDASAAAAYVTERARAADRAHVPTPRSNSR